jgi:uncharacterized membrane protein
LEVSNRGNVELTELQWSLPEDAGNWKVFIDVLPKYPIPVLEPGDHVRVPLAITMGGPAAVDIRLQAQTRDGQKYERTRPLSIW